MHNRFFCTGVKLFFFLSGSSTAFWNTDQCYKNIPALGLNQELLWRFPAHVEWVEESLV